MKNTTKSIIVAGIAAVALVTTGVVTYNVAYDKGYDDGWSTGAHQTEASLIIEFTREPRTDSEIWEAFHDCEMYGLPEYAKAECNK